MFEFHQKKIGAIVEENYVYASVLYYFGIKFYDYSEKTLSQVCQQKGLDTKQVILGLESVNESNPGIELNSYPIDLIIEYLKHAHYTFVKKRLPYIAGLIEAYKPKVKQYQNLAKDLKLIFPLFVEDFIHHIYEEEDTLFSYIHQLTKALDNDYNQGALFFRMESFSIQKCAVEHEAHDDEMQGIRTITDDYQLSVAGDIMLKVLFAELQDFEQELITHARIENEILFPKALCLEKDVRQMLNERVQLN